MKNFRFILISMVLVMLIIEGCKTENRISLTTKEVTSIEYNVAISGGNFEQIDDIEIVSKGVVWAKSPNPTKDNNLGSTNEGPGYGNFSSHLNYLKENTEYYVRAYAISNSEIIYGNQLFFKTTEKPEPVFYPGAGVVFDGYTYTSIVYGNGQEWMGENLRSSIYANGDPIPNVTDTDSWRELTTGAWAYYMNDIYYETIFGKLYNWYAVTDPRCVCPVGWHVPNDSDWIALYDYYGTQAEAGGKLKATGYQYWNYPNRDATNESGFSGYPGGFRQYGHFYYLGKIGFWWSSSEPYNGGFNVTSSLMYFDSGESRLYGLQVEDGASIRCIRD